MPTFTSTNEDPAVIIDKDPSFLAGVALEVKGLINASSIGANNISIDSTLGGESLFVMASKGGQAATFLCNDSIGGEFVEPRPTVFCDATNAIGLHARSRTNAAIQGDSDSDSGVKGFTHSVDQNGIFGMNDATGQVPDGINRPAGNGVWGHTKVQNGSGVFGSVEPGVGRLAAGVTGVGPTAGRFFGDVDIKGDLSVGKITAEGQDLFAIIQQLQTQVEQLQTQVGQIGITYRGLAVHPPAFRPVTTIDTKATTTGGPGPQSIRVFVPGFSATTYGGTITDPSGVTHDVGGPAQGGGFTISLPNGTVLTLSATDGTTDHNDVTGNFWSTPVTYFVS